MAFSEMSSRDKTLIIVLTVVIVAALVGIGLLAAKLLSDGKVGNKEPEITVAPTSAGVAEAVPDATITPIDAPSLEELAQPPQAAAGTEPVAIARKESVGSLAPVLIVDQPLQPGHRYRLEVSAADGSQVALEGNWSQAATSASGKASAPQIEFFEGATPYNVDIVPPVADPKLWSVSASAGLKKADVMGKSPILVITIWDVTGSQ